MLSDGFGRQFEYLRLSITDVCNFSCQYCLPDGYQKTHKTGFLTKPEISRLIQAFAHLGTKKIRITGGEPSLRRDLTDIIAIAKQQPGIEQVSLTTNAYKLGKFAKIWYEHGLDSVNVSVDSFDPHQFAIITGSTDLVEILKGIDKALEIGLRVKLNLVLMRKFNAKVLQQVLHYIKDKSVTFRFIELMETGDNADFFQQQHVSGNELQTQIRHLGFSPVARDAYAGPANIFSHPDYEGKLGLIMPYGKGFCDTCNRLRVSAIGKLHLCLFADEGYDLRPLLENDDPSALAAHIRQLMPHKKPTHYLSNNDTGATTHLAMLGG
ncbi:MAG: GTP 3',8-cyclase MoaA [Glaciecola sp.]